MNSTNSFSSCKWYFSYYINWNWASHGWYCLKGYFKMRCQQTLSEKNRPSKLYLALKIRSEHQYLLSGHLCFLFSIFNKCNISLNSFPLSFKKQNIIMEITTYIENMTGHPKKKKNHQQIIHSVLKMYTFWKGQRDTTSISFL